jgi:osmotically-inducible protein OsmY
VRSIKSWPLLGALGAGLAFFFDPVSGKSRRKTTADRVAGRFRRGGRRAARAGRGVAAGASGLSQKALHIREEQKPQPDDVTLARKVETEIFREREAPKGSVDVNAENGVVYLRGEVDRPELIEELEKATRGVQGVRDVQNYLHLPGVQPEMKS